MADELSKAAKMMKAIDIAMLVTKTKGDKIAARPMSNNKDVSETDGTSYHFATDDGRIDDDIRHSDECGATYSDGGESFVAVQGRAKLHRDRAVHEKHWVKDLEKWFDKGLDTEGLILIEVSPERIAWWKGREDGEWVA